MQTTVFKGNECKISRITRFSINLFLIKKKKTKQNSIFLKRLHIHKGGDLCLGSHVTKGKDEIVFAKPYGKYSRFQYWKDAG